MKFTYSKGDTPLAGYTIEHGIGSGGFGEVYLGVSDAGKQVALKKIQRNLDIELRGARQCINLNHVNLISLWDIRKDDQGESWVIMEYVRGPNLKDLLRSYPDGLPGEEVKSWFLSIASGVAYLHDQEIVHRDLKPGNIFFDEKSRVVKIGDYGLSKFISVSGRSGQTETVGTFHYMAPEIGRGHYGQQIDIYAMGVILYEILTGKLPFDGETTHEIIMKHLTEDPCLDLVPEDFRGVIGRSLLKDPAERYQNIVEMLQDVPWPDVIQKREQIISLTAVGPIWANRTASPSVVSPVNPASGESNQILNYGSTPDLRPTVAYGEENGKFSPPIIVGGDAPGIGSRLPAPGEIIFGPLKTVPSPADNRPAPSRTSQSNRPKSDSNPHSRPFDSKTPVDFIDARGRLIESHATHSSQSAPEPWAQAPQKPMAGAVSRFGSIIAEWWTSGNVSIPVKLLIGIIAGIVIGRNADWLWPLTLGLGLTYLVYYGLRRWWSGPKLGAKMISKPNSKLRVKKNRPQVRGMLRMRSLQERAIELTAAFLLSAFACLVFNLLGLSAYTGNGLNDISWAIYAWMTGTTIFTSWGLLLIGKFWEDHLEDVPRKRVRMLILGTLTGLFCFCLAGFFGLDLNDFAPSGLRDSEFTPPIVIQGMPVLLAYWLYFSGLMVVLRWWTLTDPLRVTRLSILSVSFCLIWACLLSNLLELPVMINAIMAVVTSVSIQLAAPWISESRRLGIFNSLT